jgi:signal transduction histidine kinase
MVEERTQQLLHADRLATIGTFAAAVAHEVNGPLTYIGASAELLQLFWEEVKPFMNRHVSGDETAHHAAGKVPRVDGYIAAILEGQKRIAQTVDTLRTYSRKDGESIEPCFLTDPADDAVRLVRHRCKHGVSIEISIPPDLRILCNRRKISQVFINLFANAIDAMPEQRGFIRVDAVPADGCVNITIKDSGYGIPDKMSEIIFDPFYTTKGEEQGTGLGLYIVRNIIQEQGGKIFLAPYDGTGAQFHITLPLLQ